MTLWGSALIALMQAGTLSAGTVNLAWDPSSDPTVSEYNIYYGAASGAYTNKIPVGNNTNAAISGLVGGVSYFFAATASDPSGDESDYSNEISYSIPTGPLNHPPTISAIADLSTVQGNPTSPIPFTIGDTETNASNLTLSAASSDTALVPDSNIIFGGDGSNRTVTITPLLGETGASQITITVSDGSASTNATFTLFVVASPTLLVTNLTDSSYSGLFYEEDSVRVQSAGAFNLSVAAGGDYSGSLQMSSGRYSFAGHFSLLCQSTNLIKRKNSSPLIMSFSLGDSNQVDQVFGQISDGGWTADIHGERAGGYSKINPAPQAGNYTFVIPGGDNFPAPSLGNGFGTARVSAAGTVRFAGTLADGTKVSQSAVLSKSGRWPLFVPLYSGQGLVISWLSFTNQTNSDVDGPLSWIKSPNPNARFYSDGLAVECNAIGSVYIPDPNPFHPTIAVLGNDSSTNEIVRFRFAPSIGTFSGSFLDPSGKPREFKGAVLQKSNAGYGFLLGTNQSNPVLVTP